MKVWRVIVFLSVLGASGVVVADKDKAPAKTTSATEPHKRPASSGAAPGKPATDKTAADKTAADKTAGDQVEVDDDGDGGHPLANIPHLVGPRPVNLGHSAQIELP